MSDYFKCEGCEESDLCSHMYLYLLYFYLYKVSQQKQHDVTTALHQHHYDMFLILRKRR